VHLSETYFADSPKRFTEGMKLKSEFKKLCLLVVALASLILSTSAGAQTSTTSQSIAGNQAVAELGAPAHADQTIANVRPFLMMSADGHLAVRPGMDQSVLSHDEQTLLQGALINVNGLISQRKFTLHPDLTLTQVVTTDSKQMCGGSNFFHLHWYGWEGGLNGRWSGVLEFCADFDYVGPAVDTVAYVGLMYGITGLEVYAWPIGLGFIAYGWWATAIDRGNGIIAHQYWWTPVWLTAQ